MVAISMLVSVRGKNTNDSSQNRALNPEYRGGFKDTLVASIEIHRNRTTLNVVQPAI